MGKRIFSAVLLFLLLFSFGASAGEVISRVISGEVVARNTGSKPPTVVVKAKDVHGRDLIIGAAVLEDTRIEIGASPAMLEEVMPGDKATIEYERNKRVVAKSLKIKR